MQGWASVRECHQSAGGRHPRLRESPESTELLFVMANQPKMQPTGADVVAFMEAISNVTRRADARALCVLLSEITGEPPVLWGAGIVGFGSYHYRYESGHEGNAPLAVLPPVALTLLSTWSAGSPIDTSGYCNDSGRSGREDLTSHHKLGGQRAMWEEETCRRRFRRAVIPRRALGAAC